MARGTVLRAGYGIYFGPLGMRRGDVRQYGFSRNTRFIPTKDTGLTFYSTLSNPYPDGILEPEGKAGGYMTDVGNSITFFNPQPHGQLQPALADQHPAPVPRATT